MSLKREKEVERTTGNFTGIETERNPIRVDRLGVCTYNVYVQIRMN